MSRLDDLMPDITEMSEDELIAFIREVRKDRRITKTPTKVRRSQGKVKDKLQALLADMTPEQRKEILSGGS